MRLLDITLDTAIENIALDEALLMHSEQTGEQFLRFWKPQQYAVVMGRSGKLEQEAVMQYCRENQIPVYRRPSGGGTILTGPGCLMYATILNSQLRRELKEIQGCHNFVLNEMATALNQLGILCKVRGISDLAIDGRKFSGNSLRLKRNSILYHGTILCDFNLITITDSLLPPPKEPEYRQGRSHSEFLMNLERSIEEIQTAVEKHWKPVDRETEIPANIRPLWKELMDTKYQQANWNILESASKDEKNC